MISSKLYVWSLFRPMFVVGLCIGFGKYASRPPSQGLDQMVRRKRVFVEGNALLIINLAVYGIAAFQIPDLLPFHNYCKLTLRNSALDYRLTEILSSNCLVCQRSRLCTFWTGQIFLEHNFCYDVLNPHILTGNLETFVLKGCLNYTKVYLSF